MKKKLQKIILSFVLFTFLSFPFLVSAKSYWNPPYRKDIGLNVHWALSGFDRDELYKQRLQESRTEWAREHFFTEVFVVEKPEAWFERYDMVMKNYREQNINVVGMLAYGMKNGDFSVPDEKEWLDFVEIVVRRYKNDVKIWEVWNEPDSPDFLAPNQAKIYAPLLSITYDKIKSIDPEAKVMNGGLATPDVNFAQTLFTNARGKFDIFNVHYYYADEYVADGDLHRLDTDAKRLRKYVDSQKPGMPIWVTEMGASTGSYGIDENSQTEYLKESTRLLMQSGYVNKILLYNIRNFDYNSDYENNFGLLDVNMNSRPSWEWYKSIPKGPYDIERHSIAYEEQKAKQLKTELEKYFGKGLIPISADNWPIVVQSYIYGGYNDHAIAQAIRYGGKVVHPMIPYKYWKEEADFKEYINKDWTGGLIIWAYGKPRIKVTDEGKKAQELTEALKSGYDFENLRIDITNWGDLVKAYVYGDYPLDAIAKSIRTDWGTVSKDEKFETYKKSSRYQEAIKVGL